MWRSNRQFHAAAASNRTNSDKTFSQRRSKMKRVLRKENMLLIATLLILFMPILYIYRNDNVENDEGRTIMGEKNETNHEAARDANNEVDYTHSGMWDILDCEEIFESERPINSHSTWKHARTLYRGIVGEESSIGDTDDEPTGFSVPVEAKQSLPKGRGIFALRDITAGELIWSTKKTARFQDGPSYRKFILGLEAGSACDSLEWSYVQDMGDGELRISVDLDEGALCNDGEWDGGEANTGCDEEAARDVQGGCIDNYFALSDIKAGEEFLCSYAQFAVSSGWKEFGL